MNGSESLRTEKIEFNSEVMLISVCGVFDGVVVVFSVEELDEVLGAAGGEELEFKETPSMGPWSN